MNTHSVTDEMLSELNKGLNSWPTAVLFLYIQGVWTRTESSMISALSGTETAWRAPVRTRAWAAVASKTFVLSFTVLHLLFSRNPTYKRFFVSLTCLLFSHHNKWKMCVYSVFPPTDILVLFILLRSGHQSVYLQRKKKLWREKWNTIPCFYTE